MQKSNNSTVLLIDRESFDHLAYLFFFSKSQDNLEISSLCTFRHPIAMNSVIDGSCLFALSRCLFKIPIASFLWSHECCPDFRCLRADRIPNDWVKVPRIERMHRAVMYRLHVATRRAKNLSLPGSSKRKMQQSRLVREPSGNEPCRPGKRSQRECSAKCISCCAWWCEGARARFSAVLNEIQVMTRFVFSTS